MFSKSLSSMISYVGSESRSNTSLRNPIDSKTHLCLSLADFKNWKGKDLVTKTVRDALSPF